VQSRKIVEIAPSYNLFWCFRGDDCSEKLLSEIPKKPTAYMEMAAKPEILKQTNAQDGKNSLIAQ
jgi:Zn/Cd-binding protein ZinT